MSHLIRAFRYIRPCRTVLLLALTTALFLGGCSQPAPTPTASPTVTASPTASPTDTPTPGIGVAASSPTWEIVITGVRQLDRLQSGLDTYHPNEGYTFLVVDTTIRALTMPSAPDATATSQAVAATSTAIATAGTLAFTLEPTAGAEISSAAVAILDADGAIHTADGAIVSGMGCANCVTWSYASTDMAKEMSFVFVLRVAAAFEPYRLHFQDAPPIPFELEGEPPAPATRVLPSPTIPVPVVATVEPTSIPATAAPLEPPTSPAPSKGPQPSPTVVALAPTAATPEKMNLALTNEAQAATQNAQAATLDAQAAATIGFRQTQTAHAVASFTATATPNLEQTLGAIVAQTDTSQAATDIAIMIASYTKTPTATPTPSFTPTFTMTPTATATPTSTYTPTATPTPALIVMPDPPPDLVLSPANAAQIHEL
ncbi:MAG: hypothetical protein IT323_18560, partial [Anaerolineae bacterium]|nr:hypothetical protein [Anaerolineae bacterium]